MAPSTGNGRFAPTAVLQAPTYCPIIPVFVFECNRKGSFPYCLNHDFIRQELWNRAGDHDTMRWNPSMDYPEPK